MTSRPAFLANNELALHAALAQLQAAGCTAVPIGPHAQDGFYVRDPFGVLFDVIERS